MPLSPFRGRFSLILVPLAEVYFRRLVSCNIFFFSSRNLTVSFCVLPAGLLMPASLLELKRLCCPTTWDGMGGPDPFPGEGAPIFDCPSYLSEFEDLFKEEGYGCCQRSGLGGVNDFNSTTLPTLRWALETGYYRSVPLIESIVVSVTGSDASLAQNLWADEITPAPYPARLIAVCSVWLKEENLENATKHCLPAYRAGKAAGNIFQLPTNNSSLESTYDDCFVLLDLSVGRVIFTAFGFD